MELPEHLSVESLSRQDRTHINLSSQAIDRVTTNRAYLDGILTQGLTYYGINTGFGSLCHVRVKDSELKQLQENLVCSHAAGMGDEVSEEIVRLMLLLKIHGLSLGYSGVRPQIVQRLADFYNMGILPVVYEQGSLGASGDLAPLAHLSLPLLGQGVVNYKGSKQTAAAALKAAGLKPIALAAKEGLALLNGTQFMSAFLVWSLIECQRLLVWADTIGALSADTYLAKDEPFKSPIHRVRPHTGQVASAARILKLLAGSGIQKTPQRASTGPLFIQVYAAGAWGLGGCGGHCD